MYETIPNSLPHKLCKLLPERNSLSVSVRLLAGRLHLHRTFSEVARLQKMKPFLYQDDLNNGIVILRINTRYNFRYLTWANTVTLTSSLIFS